MRILSRFHLFTSAFLLSLLCLALPGFSQTSIIDEQPKRAPDEIRLILVQGNEKTHEEIIIREMKLQPGTKFNAEEMERDRLRIQNLGIFNRVEIDIVPTNDGIILVVSVSEMWYIFPYPIIFRNDRDWGRISIGAGLLHTNFRGRREVVDFSGWLGFNPAMRLSYSNPWIFGKAKFYAKVSVFLKRIRNRSFTTIDSVLNEKHLGGTVTIGKRFGHFTYFDVNVGYRQLTLSPEGFGRTLSPSGKDRLPKLGFSFRYDSRDLWEYAHQGYYLNIWAYKTGFLSETVNYFRYGVDLRKYIPVGPTTLAFRAANNFSLGRIPIYERVYFGFSTRIRGHFKDRIQGENLLLGSAEFRFPILPIRYFNWGAMDATMGQYGANLRLGLSGGLFFDTGNVWFRDEIQGPGFDMDSTISGWGGGLHIFLPYNLLMRLEYGFNEDWDGQFIIDALVSF